MCSSSATVASPGAEVPLLEDAATGPTNVHTWNLGTGRGTSVVEMTDNMCIDHWHWQRTHPDGYSG